MGERKVLNKYYPPDFDSASKLPKVTRDKQYVVRIMAPCTMRCITCGNHVCKGKKFNARKETVENEKYLGLQIFRFYIRCPWCLAEITFKTDPESTDYFVEQGAYSTFQGETQQKKEEEEANNPMLSLENQTKESGREMDKFFDVLEDIREVNAQREQVLFDQLMNKHLEKERKDEAEQEQLYSALAKAAFGAIRNFRKRSQDDSSSDEEHKKRKSKQGSEAKKPKTDSKRPTNIGMSIRKEIVQRNAIPPLKQRPKPGTSFSLVSKDYDSD